MTTADKKPFAAIYNTLCVQSQHRLTPQQHAIEEVTYFNTLSDVSLDAVQASADRIAREGDGWFPKTAHWLMLAREEQKKLDSSYQPQRRMLTSDERKAFAARREGVIAKLRRRTGEIVKGITWARLADAFSAVEKIQVPTVVPVYVCSRCEDSGWIKTTDTRGGVTLPASEMCPCRATNPAFRAIASLPVTERTRVEQQAFESVPAQKQITGGE